MPEFKWNPLKSKRLKQTRGASFEEVLKGQFIEMVDHPTRADQKVLLMWCKNYIWAIPCIETESEIFLKTLYRCRKYTKLFRKGKLW